MIKVRNWAQVLSHHHQTINWFIVMRINIWCCTFLAQISRDKNIFKKFNLHTLEVCFKETIFWADIRWRRNQEGPENKMILIKSERMSSLNLVDFTGDILSGTLGDMARSMTVTGAAPSLCRRKMKCNELVL